MKKKKSEEELEKLLVDFTDSLTVGACEAVETSPEEVGSESDERIKSLFEAIQTISSVIQPRQIPEGFAARISQAAQERFQGQISADKIQRIIGMAVTMEDFRKSLFQDISVACRSIGLSLTPEELAALRNLKEDAVKEFANSLDERITKFFPINLP